MTSEAREVDTDLCNCGGKCLQDKWPVPIYRTQGEALAAERKQREATNS